VREGRRWSVGACVRGVVGASVVVLADTRVCWLAAWARGTLMRLGVFAGSVGRFVICFLFPDCVGCVCGVSGCGLVISRVARAALSSVDGLVVRPDSVAKHRRSADSFGGVDCVVLFGVVFCGGRCVPGGAFIFCLVSFAAVPWSRVSGSHSLRCPCVCGRGA
jgi:hypothetical protein